MDGAIFWVRFCSLWLVRSWFILGSGSSGRRIDSSLPFKEVISGDFYLAKEVSNLIDNTCYLKLNFQIPEDFFFLIRITLFY
jgi:hypothetical protein